MHRGDHLQFKILKLTSLFLVYMSDRLHDAKHAASFRLSNYQMINLHRQNGRAEGGVCIFIHESIDFKESEIFSIKITNKTRISSVYRSSDTSLKEFKNPLKLIFDNIRRKSKDLYLLGGFNINILDYEKNVKVRNFPFQNSLTV